MANAFALVGPTTTDTDQKIRTPSSPTIDRLFEKRERQRMMAVRFNGGDVQRRRRSRLVVVVVVVVISLLLQSSATSPVAAANAKDGSDSAVVDDDAAASNVDPNININDADKPTTTATNANYYSPTTTANTTDSSTNNLNDEDDSNIIDYGNHNHNWEDGPSSWSEFGHDNAPDICRLPLISVEEWESGRYWERDTPVMVANVTAHWDALHNWQLHEMLARYPDAEATMGDGRRVGEIGPDGAGNLLTPTTVQEFITKWMYHPQKYFFDRKISIPTGMLNDCHPFPEPTRSFLTNPTKDGIYAPSKKRKVNPKPNNEIWRDHLAIAIGSDLQGLSFHHHGAAWNVVIFEAMDYV
ncbi:LOW QUALITY PROTEIN: hypothetical protein ACHAXH_001094 [Discostella pseudostelligera]